MLTSVDVKFIFDSACLSASLEDKGLLSSAFNILQIADVIRLVVFLLFSGVDPHLFSPFYNIKFFIIPFINIKKIKNFPSCKASFK